MNNSSTLIRTDSTRTTYLKKGLGFLVMTSKTKEISMKQLCLSYALLNFNEAADMSLKKINNPKIAPEAAQPKDYHLKVAECALDGALKAIYFLQHHHLPIPLNGKERYIKLSNIWISFKPSFFVPLDNNATTEQQTEWRKNTTAKFSQWKKELKRSLKSIKKLPEKSTAQ